MVVDTVKLLGGGVLALAFVLASVAAAEEPEKSNDEQRAEHQARLLEVASSIRLLADPEREDSAVKLVAEPILRYTDNTRQIDGSSLWVWSGGGRPTAIVAVEYYPNDRRGPRWLFEIASLSTKRIAAHREPELNFTAKEPGLSFAPLADAEPPADRPARRLIQMNAIARRFAVHTFATVDGRIELRQLSRPLLRYSDDKAEILDGAVIAFTYGTNPEVLLVLEARKRGDTPAAWHYAFAQMTGAAIVANLDGKEVWQQGEADPPAVRNSYVNGWLTKTGSGEK
jgi:hypothetical protein